MAAVQIGLVTNPAQAVPGMLVDSQFVDVVSKIATEDIPFGVAVAINGDNCELPDTSGEVTGVAGIAILDPNKPSGGSQVNGGTMTGGYKTGDIVAVLRRGRVWVQVANAVTAGSNVQVRYAGTAVVSKGEMGNTSTASETDAALASAKFETAQATVGGLAVVNVSQP